MNDRWQHEAERMGGQPLVVLLTEMRDNQLDMRADFEQLSQRVVSVQAANDLLLSGFPARDVEGHRRYHESVIEWRELRNKMVKETLAKMVQAGTLAALGWLAVAIWQTFKITVTK